MVSQSKRQRLEADIDFVSSQGGKQKPSTGFSVASHGLVFAEILTGTLSHTGLVATGCRVIVHKSMEMLDVVLDAVRWILDFGIFNWLIFYN